MTTRLSKIPADDSVASLHSDKTEPEKNAGQQTTEKHR